MLTEQQLDQFIDEFWEDTPNEAQEEEPAEDLEEYTLPSDGMIIRQMEKKGKVNRRTWFLFHILTEKRFSQAFLPAAGEASVL